MKKSIKVFTIAMLTIVAISSMTSCNRGGSGCPMELKMPTGSLINIIK
jgi:hypothetical protein